MNLQRVFTVCALVLLVAMLAGCAFLEDLRLFKGQPQEDPPQGEPEVVVEGQLGVEPGAAAPAGDQGQAAAPEDGGAINEEAEDANAAGGADVPATETRQVVLYFAAADGSSLEAETRDIPKQDGIARATVNELIAGPQSDSLDPTLPASAILEGITINQGLCTVDFSSELVEHLSADSQDQLLAVYSIVNTLTQFDSVEHVRILVDGAPINANLGGVDLTAALAPTLLF